MFNIDGIYLSPENNSQVTNVLLKDEESLRLLNIENIVIGYV